MATTESNVTAVVKRYCQELGRMGIPCERVFLFGSQAAGQAEDGSDIDLIVISPAWEAYSARERLELLGVAAARILEPIQALAATPEEVKTRRLSLFMKQLLDEQAVVIA
jgi:uncharacterized protein